MNSIPCINWVWNFFERVPTHDDLKKWFGDQQGGILFLDDLMLGGGDDKDTLNLFTQYSHHLNVTVFYLCQDMFPKGKYAKTISRNAQYIIVFKNPRDNVALRTLSTPMYRNKKSCVPSWTHIINALRDLFVIWPSMYILRVVMIQDS